MYYAPDLNDAVFRLEAFRFTRNACDVIEDESALIGTNLDVLARLGQSV